MIAGSEPIPEVASERSGQIKDQAGYGEKGGGGGSTGLKFGGHRSEECAEAV
jgi:hypothetical protein